MTGRDPQRLYSPTQRAAVADKQHHQCLVCESDLPEVFHVHHVVPWGLGGPTTVENGMAVCPDCHLKAPVRDLRRFAAREWQAEALAKILPILRNRAFATLSAAPGAGKTLFGGWAYWQMAATNDCARIVWFVPNSNLRKQVRTELKKLGIYLDGENSRNVTERSGRDGIVLTYHVLSDPAKLQQIIADADATPTLFILDEVHHLAIAKEGSAGAWSLGIARIAGSVKAPLHPVLNMSGTLFRSNKSERISTIRYAPRTRTGRSRPSLTTRSTLGGS